MALKNPQLGKMLWVEVPLLAKKEDIMGICPQNDTFGATGVPLSQNIVLMKGLFRQAPKKFMEMVYGLNVDGVSSSPK